MRAAPPDSSLTRPADLIAKDSHSVAAAATTAA